MTMLTSFLLTKRTSLPCNPATSYSAIGQAKSRPRSAAAFAILSHALFYVMPIILGVGYLWHRRELWQDVLSNVSARREPDEATQRV